MIRSVRFVKNAVEWRKILAGRVAEKCRLWTGSDRIWRLGSDELNWARDLIGSKLDT